MIEAILAINEYMVDAIENAGLALGELYPGPYAPSTENSNTFCLYNIVPNNNPELVGMQTDEATYTIYNSDFITINRIGRVINDTFNLEFFSDTSLNEDGIRFLDTSVSFTGSGGASFLDGREYFLLHFTISVEYTIEPEEEVGP